MCDSVLSYERNRCKFEHPVRNGMGNKICSINISKYEQFTRKINKTHSHPVSIVVSGDFCRFKLALSSLLFLSKNEVKAAHSDFENPPIGIFSAILKIKDHLIPKTCLNTKTPRTFCRERAFSTCISKFASLWRCFDQAD